MQASSAALPVAHALVLKVEVLDEEGEERDEAGLGPLRAGGATHGGTIHGKVVAGIEIGLPANKNKKA